MTKIGVMFGLVVNLGNYESARIEVHCERDVKERETLDEAYQRVAQYVEERALEKAKEIKPRFRLIREDD